MTYLNSETQEFPVPTLAKLKMFDRHPFDAIIDLNLTALPSNVDKLSVFLPSPLKASKGDESDNRTLARKTIDR